MKHMITEDMLKRFYDSLLDRERAAATIEKYIRDIRVFKSYAERTGGVDKENVLAYKNFLRDKYAAASVNSMLAALNCFFREMDWNECIIKFLKIQKNSFRSQKQELSKGEYYRLLDTAKKRGDERLYLLMQTICATGIRVSELKFITVGALNTGQAAVSLKGKTRTVLIPNILRGKLKKYIKKNKIKSGSIFITRNGRPMDRSNICHAMKALCREAGVMETKVFPHNLRHLFACTYYQKKKDITHLADILGHANINTTRIYTLVSKNEQIRQIETLGLVV